MLDTTTLIKQSLLRTPQVRVLLSNILLQPMGDGLLRVEITTHAMFASIWEAFIDHGMGKEVELKLKEKAYWYQAQLGPDQRIYLHPSDSNTDGLPDASIFTKRAVNLFLSW